MSLFISQGKLPSCLVTKELIQSIEDYFSDKYTHIHKVTPENEDYKFRLSLQEQNSRMSVEIEDNLGIEKLNTIKEHALSKFSDSTTSITIRYRVEYLTPKVSFTVDFDEERSGSTYRLEYDGPDARDIIQGMKEGLLTRINTTKNENYLYHPLPFLDGLLSALLFSLSSLPFWLYSYSSTLSISLGVFIVILAFYLYTAPKLKPYTSFESNISRVREERWTFWVMTVLVLTILAALITKLIDYYIFK